jgi:DNA-binding transcriptional MerR regulator
LPSLPIWDRVLTNAVPYKEPKIEKVFYSISEVAAMLGVNASLIRFWDKEFSVLKLQKNKKGNRLFTQEDIQQIRVIYHLVKEKGMTLKGAQQLLHKNREGTVKTAEVVERLLNIRQQLTEIRNELAGDERTNDPV